MAYSKISDMTAGSALTGTELFEAVQSSASVKITGTQIKTYVDPAAGIANTVTITGDYLLTDGNELDYSSSFSNDMASTMTTFTELPTTTREVLVLMEAADTSVTPRLLVRRSTSSTSLFGLNTVFADHGTNRIAGTQWIPTNGNYLLTNTVIADTTIVFTICGYKTGA